MGMTFYLKVLKIMKLALSHLSPKDYSRIACFLMCIFPVIKLIHPNDTGLPRGLFTLINPSCEIMYIVLCLMSCLEHA